MALAGRRVREVRSAKVPGDRVTVSCTGVVEEILATGGAEGSDNRGDVQVRHVWSQCSRRATSKSADLEVAPGGKSRNTTPVVNARRQVVREFETGVGFCDGRSRALTGVRGLGRGTFPALERSMSNTDKLTWEVYQSTGFAPTRGMVMGSGLTKSRAAKLATRLGAEYASRPEAAR